MLKNGTIFWTKVIKKVTKVYTKVARELGVIIKSQITFGTDIVPRRFR